MSSDEVDPVFVSWDEQAICQERGKRVIHFYLKHVSGNSELAVVGTERSVRHMLYIVPQQFLQVYGSTTSVFKWRARREVVDWLNHLISRNQSHRAALQGDSAPTFGYLNGINADNKKLSDRMISRKLKFQSSDIAWYGSAWFCAKQLKHYSGFYRNRTKINVHSFVYIMAQEENHYLAYLEDMYEDKKKQKRVKVRWFHRGQEVKNVMPELDLKEGEVFITPNVQVISAECVNGPATVLTRNHYEQYKADAPHTSSSEIHMCCRQLKNNKLKTFALTKLRGYSNQSILSCLDSPTLSKRKANCANLENGENFTQDDPLRSCNKRNRSSVKYSVPEKGSSGSQNASTMDEMPIDKPMHPKLKLKLLIKRTGYNIFGPKPQLPFKVNDKIEVLSQDSGIRGCWFRCTILHVCAFHKKLKVRYDDLMDADDEDKLMEWIPASKVAHPDKLGMRCFGRLTVRPRPPEFVKGRDFEIGAAVDVWCGDGWWESVMIDVNVSGAETCLVYSSGEHAFQLVEKKHLRISRDFIHNDWVDILGKPDINSYITSNVDKLGKPKFINYITSNDSSRAKSSTNSAVVDGSMTGGSAISESKPSPIAKVEGSQKVEEESSGLEALNGSMKGMTLQKPPLHAIHEDENINSGGGFDGDTDKYRNSHSSSDVDGDDEADNTGEDSDEDF